MTNPAVGDERYIGRGDANTDGSVRILWVADADGDGQPDAKLQARVNGAWLDVVQQIPAGASSAQAVSLGQIKTPLRAGELGRYVKVFAGIDSMTDGAGGNIYLPGLATLLKAKFGDGGPGYISASVGSGGTGSGASVTKFGTGVYWASTTSDGSTAQAYSASPRSLCPGGNGAYTVGANISGTPGVGIVPGASFDYGIVHFRFMSSGASFRFSQRAAGPLESTGTGLVVTEGTTYPSGTDCYVIRPFNASYGVGLSVEFLGGDVVVYGIEFLNNSGGATLSNLGVGGTKMSDHASITTLPYFGRVLNPSALILIGGTNDRATDDASKYLRSASAYVDNWRTYRDFPVILCNPPDASDSGSNNLPSYAQALKHLALSRNLAYLDIKALLGGSYSAANTAGLMYDGVHWNAAGQGLFNTAVMARLRGL